MPRAACLAKKVLSVLWLTDLRPINVNLSDLVDLSGRPPGLSLLASFLEAASWRRGGKEFRYGDDNRFAHGDGQRARLSGVPRADPSASPRPCQGRRHHHAPERGIRWRRDP